ncbi:hypothetical protein FCT18_20700 [Lysinibacillus sphaericus]|uniref:DUF5405 domain-containing protein n=1 Tax=Lysinibacillus sphaericus TaxID=1421 RepID=A0A2S0K5L6_LYSSH|nr:hypothetical protein [Lysinibacillus sphaericus]AVK98662.1 hypothetical protein LS41612_21225 [Lysinibacillus sphaericus]MED4544422.1 hypothetical protein [Lysinibacillus sphaericus]TKI16471.1 hypothetical protein FCT18_20700 [Lysinibacillus sphaericus]SUV15351.1 Uncharacterised protein [Lysinibacillus sphaericus]GEC84499.1 hypothetical protein LSP03_42420 [Lysinibacillus sphaericus]
MAETKEKPILIDLGTVRIKEYDNLNVQIERLEEVYNPTTKETTSKWRFKGYSNTILNALTVIVNKELLIDKKAINGLKNYLKQVEEIHNKIKIALEGEK